MSTHPVENTNNRPNGRAKTEADAAKKTAPHGLTYQWTQIAGPSFNRRLALLRRRRLR